MPYLAKCKDCGWIVASQNERLLSDLQEAHNLHSHENDGYWSESIEVPQAWYNDFIREIKSKNKNRAIQNARNVVKMWENNFHPID